MALNLDNELNNDLNIMYNTTTLEFNPSYKPQTILEEILIKYPNKRWNFYCLSENKCITKEFILAHPNFKWFTSNLIKNENFSIEDLLNYTKLNINDFMKKYIIYIYENPNCDFDFIKKTYHFIHDKTIIKDNYLKYYILSYISRSPNVTVKDILDTPYIDWELTYVFDNPNFEWKYLNTILNFFVEKKEYKIENLVKDTLYLSKHKNITLDIIENNRDFPWNHIGISNNPNITIDFIKKQIDSTNPQFIKLDWYAISRNIGIKMNDILENNHLPWDYRGVLRNPNMDIKYLVEKLIHLMKQTRKYIFEVPEHYILLNTSLTIKDLDYFETENIDFHTLSENTFNYNSSLVYWNQRKYKTIKNTQIFKEELLQITWEFNWMINWCICEKEKYDILNTFKL